MPRTLPKIVAMQALTFDDVLLLPRFTNFKRQAVDLTTVLHRGVTLRLPVLSSPMDSVTELPMVIAMAQHGGLGVLHRNLQPAAQAAMVRAAKKTRPAEGASVDRKGRLLVAAAVGAGSDLEERVRLLISEEVDVLVVDSGHGHSQFILDAVTFIKKQRKTQTVMAGNVATYEGAKALIAAGADILRVGIGPGSICTTRIVTGMGVPQLTAILETVRAAKPKGIPVVADGGLRQMGDMAKALAAGAHAVMLGSLLAGYDESAGEAITIDGSTYKRYRGMGSVSAMKKGGAERYGQQKNTEARKLIAEGVEGLVPAKGAVTDFLYQLAGSVRSSLYYLGCKTIAEFHRNAQFVRITPASMAESHPHTIRVETAGGSYL